jgi:hypothetical protein
MVFVAFAEFHRWMKLKRSRMEADHLESQCVERSETWNQIENVINLHHPSIAAPIGLKLSNFGVGCGSPDSNRAKGSLNAEKIH